MTATMKRVLVLCTGNSCRSQMAEGFLRHYADGRAEIYSAGIEAHGVNPKAVSVMKEAGIDISGHTSNKVDEYSALPFDYIITVCDHARENCPYLPGPARRFHHNFPDPAKARGSEEEILHEFRRTRDMIRDYTEEFARTHLN
jgi:arsenate reductase